MQHAALCAALHQSTAAQEEATASRRESVAAMQAAKQAEALVEGLAGRVQVLEDYLQDAQIQKHAVAQELDDALALLEAEKGLEWSMRQKPKKTSPFPRARTLLQKKVKEGALEAPTPGTSSPWTRPAHPAVS